MGVNYSSSHRKFSSLLVNYLCSHGCDAGNEMLLSPLLLPVQVPQAGC